MRNTLAVSTFKQETAKLIIAHSKTLQSSKSTNIKRDIYPPVNVLL
jgi:hypothetical protein